MANVSEKLVATPLKTEQLLRRGLEQDIYSTFPGFHHSQVLRSVLQDPATGRVSVSTNAKPRSDIPAHYYAEFGGINNYVVFGEVGTPAEAEYLPASNEGLMVKVVEVKLIEYGYSRLGERTVQTSKSEAIETAPSQLETYLGQFKGLDLINITKGLRQAISRVEYPADSADD